MPTWRATALYQVLYQATDGHIVAIVRSPAPPVRITAMYAVRVF